MAESRGDRGDRRWSPGRVKTEESRSWSPRGAKTAAGVGRTRRRRPESRQSGDSDRVPGDQELAAGARRSRRLRLESGGVGGETRREQLHSGGHRDGGCLEWGAQQGGPPRHTMPGAPPAGPPVPLGLGDPKVISWGRGSSSPRAPRTAAGGAARASARGCGACPGMQQPRDPRAPAPPGRRRSRAAASRHFANC